MNCLNEFAVEDGKLQDEAVCLEYDLDNVGLPGKLVCKIKICDGSESLEKRFWVS